MYEKEIHECVAQYLSLKAEIEARKERLKKEDKKLEINEIKEDIACCGLGLRLCDCVAIAKALYEKGYRKRQ